jgi:acid phosphatase (class A)
MKKLSYLLLAFLLSFTLPIQAKDSSDTTMSQAGAKAAPYFDPASFDLKTIKALLPDPPANGSATTKSELDLIVHKQAVITLAEVVRIKNEQEQLNVYLFASVFGPWFMEKNLPVTNTLFQRVGATVHPVVELAKDHWGRSRPFQQDNRIEPPLTRKELVDLSKNPSYPSGHATAGSLDALILAELAPDLKDALMARGLQIGDDRVLAGVHFPSDVEAGRTLAHALFDKFMASADFQADLAKAKAEIAAARPAASLSATGAKP